MSFLSAAFLWAVPLAAVPVIIHLLTRRRVQVLQWGAMRFLKAAAARRRRIWHLSDILLLLLRTAAVAVFVLALARPLLRTHWFGADTGPRDVVIVLDTSMSTARLTHGPGHAGPRVFDELAEEARGIIERLGPSDVARVLAASSVPRWIVEEPISTGSGGKRELLGRLEKVSTDLSSADLLRGVREAVEAPPGNTRARRVVTVLTDGQAYGWNASAMPGWQHIERQLRALEAGGDLHAMVREAPHDKLRNLSVEAIRAPRMVAGAGEVLPVAVTIRNTGQAATAEATARWTTGETLLGTTPLPALEPGQTTTLSIDFQSQEIGTRRVSCELGVADDLPLDNRGSAVIEVAEAVPVLVVDGTARSDPARTDTAYVLAALGRSEREAVAPAWRSPFKATLVTTPELGKVPLQQYRCIILANVSRLPQDLARALVAYVHEGGGLWVALGDQAEPSVFNAAFFGRENVSALELGVAVGDAAQREQFEVVRAVAQHHPAMRLLGDEARLDVDALQVYRRNRFVRARDDVSLSVLLATAAGDPVAIEASCGRGRAIVLGVPLGVNWSNLPACQAFVVMVHEWLWYLSEAAMTRWNRAVGEELIAAFPAFDQAEAGSLQTPCGETVELRSRGGDGWRVFRSAPAVVPGSYTLKTTGADGRFREHAFEVGRDPRESDLTPISEAERQAVVSASGMRLVDDALAVPEGSAGGEPTLPVWSTLLAALLVLLTAETLLAGWLTTRRSGVIRADVRAERAAQGVTT